jgi:hypothetical protein
MGQHKKRRAKRKQDSPIERQAAMRERDTAGVRRASRGPDATGTATGVTGAGDGKRDGNQYRRAHCLSTLD